MYGFSFNAPIYNCLNDSTGMMSLYNASAADSIARNMMYTTNTFGGGFALNPTMFDFNTFGNLMNVTMGQAYQRGQLGWNPDTQSFFPQFGNFGWGAGMMGWQGSPFQCPWQTPGSGNGNSNNTTDPDKAKYNKLYNLLNKYEQYVSEGDGEELTLENGNTLRYELSQISKIKDAAEKYNKLKAVYDEIASDKAGLKDFIINNNKFEVAKGKNKVIIQNELIQAGFEYKSSALDDARLVEQLAEAIPKLATDNAALDSTILGIFESNKDGYANKTQYHILDVISSYNNDKRNLMEDIVKLSGKNKDGAKRAATILRDALVHKAEAQAKYIEDSTQRADFEEAVKELKEYDKVDKDLTEKFNKVYAQTRFIATRRVANMLASQYGEVDSNLFSKTMFDADVEKDLKVEKGMADYIEDAKNLEVKSKKGSTTPIEEPEEELTPEEKAERERKAQEEKDKKAKEEKDKKDKKINKANQNAYADGKQVYNWINGGGSGFTDGRYYSKINEKLANIDKDNVVAFLNGFETGGSHEGIIEYLDDEYDGGAISMDGKKNIITSLLEKAEELGLDSTSEYKEIKDILSDYEDGMTYAGSKNFNNGSIFNSRNWPITRMVPGAIGGCGLGVIGGLGAAAALASNPVGWVIGGALLLGAACACSNAAIDRVTDNEVIDKNMRSLLEKINAAEAKKS